jgi:hypothetical protein
MQRIKVLREQITKFPDQSFPFRSIHIWEHIRAMTLDNAGAWLKPNPGTLISRAIRAKGSVEPLPILAEVCFLLPNEREHHRNKFYAQLYIFTDFENRIRERLA